MTIVETKILIPMDLQLFADEDEYEDDDDYANGEDDLVSAIKSLKDSEDDEDEYEDDEDFEDEDDDSEDDDEEEDEDYEDEDEYEDDDSDEDEDDEEDDDEDEEEEEESTTQSKKKNAEFAAKRRQKEMEERLQRELENSPEYKLAKQLSKRFGKPVDEILTEMEEAALVDEAKETGVSVERLRKEREAEERADKLEQEINQLKFENWQTKINSDGHALKEEYPMLSWDDMDAAVEYILNEAKNVDMPLEQAIYALHGKKIIQARSKAQVQEDLASKSGRAKKNALPPNNGKASKGTPKLSADEAYIAKQFGMTADEYIKFKG
jgi:hypothetical protein